MFSQALKNSTLTADELLHIAGSEIRLCKGELATYRLKELGYGPITRFFLKHFSKY